MKDRVFLLILLVALAVRVQLAMSREYIHDEVKQGLGVREGVRIGAVKLWETDTASATYREK